MTTTSSTPLAFVDTETTHLSAEVGEVWEVAAILRTDDGESEHVWQFRPLDMAAANPKSLAIGRYAERFVVPDDCGAAYTAGGDIDPMTRGDAITEITEILRGAILIGSNAAFDDRFLRKLLNLGATEQPWHYRPICVATLAAGAMWFINPEYMAKDPKPISSRHLSHLMGVTPPGPDAAHTALADARWARDLYDAVTAGAVS